jgi:hypothetical protein
MPPEYQSLMLEQQVAKHSNADLHVRETSLKLSEDQREVILCRYVEHYSHDDVQWVESSLRVSVTDMLNWLIAHGEPQPPIQG